MSIEANVAYLLGHLWRSTRIVLRQSQGETYNNILAYASLLGSPNLCHYGKSHIVRDKVCGRLIIEAQPLLCFLSSLDIVVPENCFPVVWYGLAENCGGWYGKDFYWKCRATSSSTCVRKMLPKCSLEPVNSRLCMATGEQLLKLKESKFSRKFKRGVLPVVFREPFGLFSNFENCK